MLHSPSSGLINSLCDEISWESVFKLLPVLKRIVRLRVWHATALKPTIKYLRYTPQHTSVRSFRRYGQIVNTEKNTQTDQSSHVHLYCRKQDPGACGRSSHVSTCTRFKGGTPTSCERICWVSYSNRWIQAEKAKRLLSIWVHYHWVKAKSTYSWAQLSVNRQYNDCSHLVTVSKHNCVNSLILWHFLV